MVTWFDRVYADPLYLKLYEQSDTELAAAEAQDAMKLCRAQAGHLWLDACCGFGRHTEALRRLGLETVGVDRSAMMLRRARQRSRRAGLGVLYVQADIRSLPVVEQFDYASLFFDSFGYFDRDEDHFDALLALGMALRSHGTLLIQLTNRERLLAQGLHPGIEKRGEYVIRKHYTVDLPAGRYAWRQEIEGGGEHRRWDFDLRLFAASELSRLLQDAGFDRVFCFGDWDGSPYSAESPFLLVTARKAVLADAPPLAG
jgi:SAM-dependent methyltransferase